MGLASVSIRVLGRRLRRRLGPSAAVLAVQMPAASSAIVSANWLMIKLTCLRTARGSP